MARMSQSDSSRELPLTIELLASTLVGTTASPYDGHRNPTPQLEEVDDIQSKLRSIFVERHEIWLGYSH